MQNTIKLKYRVPLDYKEYLKTIHWLGLKNKLIYHNREAKCCVCHKKNTLLLHHERYDHLGKEKANRDVVIVCYSCHKRIHFILWIFKLPLKTSILRLRRFYLRMLYCVRKVVMG